MRDILPLHSPATPPGSPVDGTALGAALSVLAKRLATRSAVVWGEHCTECAAPTCYAACTFYTPRADGHCRRFAGGMEPVAGVAGAMRLRLRKWAKLEGRGPVRLSPPAEVAGREAATAEATGFGLVPLARRAAWRATEAARAASAGSTAPMADAFVVVGRSLKGEAAFTLTFVPAEKSRAGLFQTRFTLGAEPAQVTVPLAEIARSIDLNAPHLIQIEPVGEAEGLDIVIGFADFVVWQPNAAAQEASAPQPASAPLANASLAKDAPRRAKVVVWDLDHTVWDGILLEDGAEGVTVRPGVREAILELDQRGVLQSVASKNNREQALAALAHHGFAEFMLAPQVGWGPKSASLTRLAEALNLGLDSLVFIDDQPFERGEVSEALPTVTVLPETAVAGLLDLPLFDLPVTPESRQRRALYRVEAERAEAAEAAGGDLDAFLRGCDMVLSLAALSADTAERVYELSQRTNQLNVAATRYTRDDVARMLAGVPGEEAWTMSCTDRFGAYGLIGFVRVAPAEGRILDFFMSCRVQRKRVEAALFAWLAERMAAVGATGLTAPYRKAARNGPALELFADLGFELALAADGQTGTLSRAIEGGFEGADIVIVQAAAPSAREPELV
jgi:FkbH-like protein